MFPKMRFEIIEDDQTVCLTDDEINASVTFGKHIRDISNQKTDGRREVEFKDYESNKFVRLTVVVGDIQPK